MLYLTIYVSNYFLIYLCQYLIVENYETSSEYPTLVTLYWTCNLVKLVLCSAVGAATIYFAYKLH